MRIQFPRNILNARELKERADFLSIVERYTCMRKEGKQYLGRCPFHSERHPSFYVHPIKKIFYCFGCCIGGDLFDFVMQVENLPFSAALDWVSDFPFRQQSEQGVALASDQQSWSRYGVSEGGDSPLCSPKASKKHSQSSQPSREQILAMLEATNRRVRAIEATNFADSAALATACEPRGEGHGLFTRKNQR